MDYAESAVRIAKGRSREELDSDEMLLLSLERLVQIIGEAAAQVPQDARHRHPGVQWRRLIDTRNQLVHAYIETNNDALWRFASEELPSMVRVLRRVLAAEIERSGGPDFTLRAATPADVPELFEIHRAAMRGYVEQTWGPWDDAWQAAFFAEHFPPERQVIERDGQLAGFFDLKRHDGEFEVAEIVLAPAWQDQGIGSSLLREVLADAETSGLAVRLQVLKVNPARRLYERLGFETTGETATHYLMRCSTVSAEDAP